MSAEVLRQAAALMRKRAESARDEWGVDRWRVHECEFNAPGQRDTYAANPVWMQNHVATDDVHGSVLMVSPWQDLGCVTHASSWHPAVALAVADLLDCMAAGADRTWHDVAVEQWPEPYIRALAVADAYLGSDA